MNTLLALHNEELRALLKKYLGALKHDITLCQTAEATLAIYPQALPALVLVDERLPDSDGPELCRRLRELPQGKNCLIVQIADSEKPETIKAAFEAGADNYLLTPIEPKILKIRLVGLERELQKFLQRNQALKALKQSMTQIERAKQEWEATADSLSSVVCLVDTEGNIVRANKAIEHWNLGKVLTVKGQPVHTLFHERCRDAECPLKEFLKDAWKHIAQGEAFEQEFKDPILHKCLHVQAHPISEHGRRRAKKTDSFGVLVVNDVSERKRTEEALHRQQTLLGGVSEAMNGLLAAPNFNTGINTALEVLGKATHVDRVYIFKAHPHPENQEPAMSLIFEWARQETLLRLDKPELQNLPFNSRFQRWYNMLHENKVICGLVRDFPEAEQDLLSSQQVVSTLIAPIVIGEALWGCIGFDDCQHERYWYDEEKTTLLASAAGFGGALAHKRTEERLHYTSEELRTVFQSLPDEYFRLNTNGSILDYKLAQSKDVGISKTFIIKWASGLLPQVVEQQFDAAVAHVLKLKQPKSIVYWYPDQEGGQRYEEVRVFPFLNDQVLIAVRDMTDWKQAEAS